MKWGLLAVAVIGELRKVMNTVPGTSSYHGIYPASPEAMEKGKEIEIGEEPMEMKGMAGGRSISPAEEEWSALSIAPARHDAGISEAVGRISEAVGRISLCQKTAVQATQQATSEMASATLINRDNSGRIQLPREFETTVLSRTLASISQAEQNATGEQREMLALIRKAFELLSANKLKGVYEPVETVVRPYIRRHPEDKVVAYRFWQYEVHSEYAANNIGRAITYYFNPFKDENGNSLFKPIDFTDNFFFMHLTLGMSVTGKNRNNVFKPEDIFLIEMKKLLGANDAENEAIKQSLKTEFEQNAHQVEMFRSGVEAIFKKDADPKASDASFEQSVNELTMCEKDGTLLEILVYAVPMLKFAKGFKLIKKNFAEGLGAIEQKRFSDLMKNLGGEGQYTGCGCLDQYLAVVVALERAKDDLDFLDEAVELCQIGMNAGYPFSDLLKGVMDKISRAEWRGLKLCRLQKASITLGPA